MNAALKIGSAVLLSAAALFAALGEGGADFGPARVELKAGRGGPALELAIRTGRAPQS